MYHFIYNLYHFKATKWKTFVLGGCMFSSEKSMTSKSNKTDHLIRFSIVDLGGNRSLSGFGPRFRSFFRSWKSETRGRVSPRDELPGVVIKIIFVWYISSAQETLLRGEFWFISCHMTSEWRHQKFQKMALWMYVYGINFMLLWWLITHDLCISFDSICNCT